jgi:hypothetical protein
MDTLQMARDELFWALSRYWGKFYDEIPITKHISRSNDGGHCPRKSGTGRDISLQS